jgi:hypothetical protein
MSSPPIDVWWCFFFLTRTLIDSDPPSSSGRLSSSLSSVFQIWNRRFLVLRPCNFAVAVRVKWREKKKQKEDRKRTRHKKARFLSSNFRSSHSYGRRKKHKITGQNTSEKCNNDNKKKTYWNLEVWMEQPKSRRNCLESLATRL